VSFAWGANSFSPNALIFSNANCGRLTFGRLPKNDYCDGAGRVEASFLDSVKYTVFRPDSSDRLRRAKFEAKDPNSAE
jgi:hypothetical protein